MTGYAPIKNTHIARVCRGGGGVLTPNFGRYETSRLKEGELETLGYVIRSQILIQHHHFVAHTAKWHTSKFLVEFEILRFSIISIVHIPFHIF